MSEKLNEIEKKFKEFKRLYRHHIGGDKENIECEIRTFVQGVPKTRFVEGKGRVMINVPTWVTVMFTKEKDYACVWFENFQYSVLNPNKKFFSDLDANTLNDSNVLYQYL